ncbi:nitroreductase [Gilvimarinus sp. SDUM040013]|uniref:Putative NAD(P)H nitroreductase n=1 Tax=Gilvimarinus gilvus TaxID=3058038 RepID=A0ABU4S4R7_9GAMM|nr:nitroreductase [Gilvimarinus sp. SDUM040013]MDO3384341.1 nitroreductase [Gilvimarinus sp. SDUM040013]MDX6851507.1 nitroreductase [Gilvimarinus sp. SDUM040013]
MDAITALTERVSVPKLREPGPSAEQWRVLLGAALRAADHGQLRPWRFLTVEGDARADLGKLYCESVLKDTPDLPETFQQKLINMPLRAPALLLVVACCQAHSKVPEVEQVVSAGAAAQNVVNAAFALGLGAMWRTGDMAYNTHVLKGLGLEEGEKLIGYVYLGTPAATKSLPPMPSVEEICQSWSGQ